MNGEFGELIEYLDDKFSKADGRLENLEKGFLDLQTSIDAYAKKADTYFQEMVLMSHKMERLEKWLHQVADKVGIKLEY
jgi:hypothetical protein